MIRKLPLASDGGGAGSQASVLRFGSFELRRGQRLLLDHGREVRLGNRAFDLLLTLVERAGQVVTKDQLIARAWPNTIVEEINLRVHIAALRRVLGESAGASRYIVNVVGRGYSFVSTVTVGDERPGPVQSAANGIRERNIPAPLTRIIGRAAELDALSELVQGHRMVTIVGPGGVGKTVVALAVASRLGGSYSDGARFVDLAAISDPTQIPHSFASVLGLSLSRGDPVSDLVAFLKRRSVLLILDNCEHVIGAAAPIAESLLKGAAGVGVIATSREPLCIEGECQYLLAALEVPPKADSMTAATAAAFSSVQLFVDRAMAVARTFSLVDSNAAVVSSICKRLDGNPLALELAAARVNLLGIHELGARLEDELFSATSGGRTAVTRHQTLRATLDWSYALLGPKPQVILQRLSLFNGSFTIESAVAIAAQGDITSEEVLRSVMSLAVKSLIATDVGENPVRHRLLFATRAYAFEKLSHSGNLAQSLRYHCNYVIKLLRRADFDWETLERPQWVASYEYAIDDIRAALNWAFSPSGDAMMGAELTAASMAFGYQLGLLSEFQERIEKALSRLATLSVRQPVIEARLNAALAGLTFSESFLRSDRAIASAAELSEMTGVAKYQIGAIVQQTIFQIEYGNYRGSLACARKLATQARRMGDPQATLLANRVMAQALHFHGDHGTARSLAERVLEHPAGPTPLSYVPMQVDRRVQMLIVLARIRWLEGSAEQAVSLASECLEYALSDGPRSICQAIALAACPIAMWRGDYAEARRWLTVLLEQASRYKIAHWLRYGQCYESAIAACEAIQKIPKHDCTVNPSVRPVEGLMAHTVATFDPSLMEEERPRPHFTDDAGWCAPELMRLVGEQLLLIARTDAERRGEAMFRQSLEVAECQNALAWQLRSATSLADLWRTQGRRDMARDLLHPIYHRFKEGHRTRDLRAAEDLLESLG